MTPSSDTNSEATTFLMGSPLNPCPDQTCGRLSIPASGPSASANFVELRAGEGRGTLLLGSAGTAAVGRCCRDRPRFGPHRAEETPAHGQVQEQVARLHRRTRRMARCRGL